MSDLGDETGQAVINAVMQRLHPIDLAKKLQAILATRRVEAGGDGIMSITIHDDALRERFLEDCKKAGINIEVNPAEPSKIIYYSGDDVRIQETLKETMVAQHGGYLPPAAKDRIPDEFVLPSIPSPSPVTVSVAKEDKSLSVDVPPLPDKAAPDVSAPYTLADKVVEARASAAAQNAGKAKEKVEKVLDHAPIR